ncbi:MAG: hypothetical protein WA989_07875 [Henriciella sp.]|uniref:hypothetical protein n=1 Tax=Henriciella sp. TaxID=1968823 RepID=UPI003C7188E7
MISDEDAEKIALAVAGAVHAGRQQDLKASNGEAVAQMGDFMSKYLGLFVIIAGAVMGYSIQATKLDNLEQALTTLTNKTEKISEDFDSFRLSGDRWTAQDHTRFAAEQDQRDRRQEKDITDLEIQMRALQDEVGEVKAGQ